MYIFFNKLVEYERSPASDPPAPSWASILSGREGIGVECLKTMDRNPAYLSDGANLLHRATVLAFHNAPMKTVTPTQLDLQFGL